MFMKILSYVIPAAGGNPVWTFPSSTFLLAASPELTYFFFPHH